MPKPKPTPGTETNALTAKSTPQRQPLAVAVVEQGAHHPHQARLEPLRAGGGGGVVTAHAAPDWGGPWARGQVLQCCGDMCVHIFEAP